MSRLLIKILNEDPGNGTDEIQDDAGCVFFLSSYIWRTLLRLEPHIGFFEKLNKAIGVRCGKCGSFTVSCRDLFYAMVPEPDAILGLNWPQGQLSEFSYDLLREYAWRLLAIITEEKIITNEEWSDLQNKTMPEKKILYTSSGEFISPGEGYPLGLVFDEVYFKLSSECVSCDRIFC